MLPLDHPNATCFAEHTPRADEHEDHPQISLLSTIISSSKNWSITTPPKPDRFV